MIYVTGFDKIGKGRYRTTFDTGVRCILYRSDAALFSVSEGVAISSGQYEQLLNDILGKRAKKRAMYLLEQMDRSEQKLREKLEAGEYPQCCIDEAIRYVKQYNYLNDLRYASTYVRYNQTRLSRGQIYQKLMLKGIAKDDIQKAIEDEYTENEEEHIERLLQKKHFDSENCDEKEFRRIYQYLLRRGFKSGQILKAMKR